MECLDKARIRIGVFDILWLFTEINCILSNFIPVSGCAHK